MDGNHDCRWTVAEIKELLDQVSKCKAISQRKFRTNACSKYIDWEEIEVEGKSPQECDNAFQTVTNYTCSEDCGDPPGDYITIMCVINRLKKPFCAVVYRSLTVDAVCKLAQAKIQSKNVPLEMFPGAPKRPVTAFLIFSTMKSKEVSEKNPKMTFSEISKIMTKKWNNLSPMKKAKYTEQYEKQREAYKKAAGEFSKALCISSPKPITKIVWKPEREGYVTPLDVFSKANPEPSIHACKSAFLALSDAELIQWIWKAVDLVKQNVKSTEEKSPPLFLKDAEKAVLLKSEGLFEKPSKTLLAFYKKSNAGGKDPIQSYRNMSEQEHKLLKQEFFQHLERYIVILSSYLAKREGTMLEDEYAAHQLQLLSCQKIMKRTGSRKPKPKYKSEVKAELSDKEGEEEEEEEEVVQDPVQEYLNMSKGGKRKSTTKISNPEKKKKKKPKMPAHKGSGTPSLTRSTMKVKKVETRASSISKDSGSDDDDDINVDDSSSGES